MTNLGDDPCTQFVLTVYPDADPIPGTYSLAVIIVEGNRRFEIPINVEIIDSSVVEGEENQADDDGTVEQRGDDTTFDPSILSKYDLSKVKQAELQELNKDIPKPLLPKITPSGEMDLNYSE